MRHLRIFGLHLEHLFEHRFRSFVWFLISLTNPLIVILFWRGAFLGGSHTIKDWNLSEIQLYYLFMIIAATMLRAHIEESVDHDVRQGDLSRYLTRPISYYWIKMYEEVPYRILQGFYGVIAIVVVSWILDISLLNVHFSAIPLTIFIIVMAYFISFTFKMILGLTSLWFTDAHGLFQMYELIYTIMAGSIMPITLYPGFLQKIAFSLPFAYVDYASVSAMQGKLQGTQYVHIIAAQVFWLFVAMCVYKVVWKKGLKKFTAVGQ